MIKIEHLRKEYPNVTPLKDVSVEIHDGDVISIIGPSGTGKSTLMRCINLLEKPTSGRIWIDGDEITSPKCDINKVRQRMGNKKLMILGMGLVGNSLLSLLVREQLFRAEDILVVDQSSSTFTQYDAIGGLPANRIVTCINGRNYTDLLDHLNSGDFLIALAADLDYSIMLAECLKRGIHFICGADDAFYDDSDSDSDEQPTDEENDYAEQIHYDASRRSGRLYKKASTSIMQFGCNPGLISILTKKALQDIVREDKGEFVSANRSELLEMLEKGEYPALAARLQVRSMIETDFDTTESDFQEEPNALYSTWGGSEYEWEMNRHVIFRAGTFDTPLSVLRWMHQEDQKILHFLPETGTVILEGQSKNVRMKWSGTDGMHEVCVVPHEELVSIYDYYSVRDAKGHIEYAPNVLFLYHPSPLAMRSLHHQENDHYITITREHMRSGSETVGITLTGDRFSPRYVRTVLSIDEKDPNTPYPGYTHHSREELKKTTPTILQVSVPVFAAIKYILRHPNEGVLFPEDVSSEEILAEIERYLPVYSSEEYKGYPESL